MGIEEYMPVAKALARRYSADLQDDLVQEALISALVAIETWRPDGGSSLRRWVIQRMSSRMIDSVRKICGPRSRCESLDADSAGDRFVSAIPMPDVALVQAEQRRIVHLAVERLSDADRALLQSISDEETIAQLGARIGVSTSEAHRRLAKAKARARVALSRAA